MPRNSNEPKFTQEEMAQALIEAGGVVLGAAIRLRCSTKTVHRYVAKYKKVAEARIEARDNTLDLAETQLIAAIGRGEAWAVCFFLKTQGKDRGWIERVPAFDAGKQTPQEVIIIGGLPPGPVSG